MRFFSWVMLSLLVLLSLAACGSTSAITPVPAAAKTSADQTSTGTQAPGQSGGSITLRVFAAASLFEAFNAIAKRFEGDHPGVTVELNFSGSQQLASQISEGAPADVFASADQRQIKTVVQSGRIADGSEQLFAGNQLVLVTPMENPANINSIKDLTRPGLRLVLAAKEVPVGQYSLDFLNKASQDSEYGSGYQEDVLKNVVSYENSVKSVLNKVSLGEADAGIIYLSDLTGAQPRARGIAIPGKLNISAACVVAPIKDSQHPETAKAFIDFLLSEEGQSMLARFGFLAVR